MIENNPSNKIDFQSPGCISQDPKGDRPFPSVEVVQGLWVISALAGKGWLAEIMAGHDA